MANKKQTKSRKINYLLTAVFLVLGLGYVFLSADIIRGEFKADNLKQELTALQEKNLDLSIKYTEASSLSTVTQKSNNLLYTEVNEVNYIKKDQRSLLGVR